MVKNLVQVSRYTVIQGENDHCHLHYSSDVRGESVLVDDVSRLQGSYVNLPTRPTSDQLWNTIVVQIKAM